MGKFNKKVDRFIYIGSELMYVDNYINIRFEKDGAHCPN